MLNIYLTNCLAMKFNNFECRECKIFYTSYTQKVSNFYCNSVGLPYKLTLHQDNPLNIYCSDKIPLLPMLLCCRNSVRVKSNKTQLVTELRILEEIMVLGFVLLLNYQMLSVTTAEKFSRETTGFGTVG